jgi:NAD(P)H-dependent FMN reductase
MRWSLLNGSPRGRRSNTAILFGHLARGLAQAGQSVEIRHLAVPAERKAAPEYFAQAERFLLGFPLYTDAMPGQVMDFIERLEPLCGRADNPPVAFLVQSGFPEPGQSRAVEALLERLARRLGSEYLGTIVKGGVEGIQLMPPWMTRKLVGRIEAIGLTLGKTGTIDAKALRELAGPDWLRGWRAPILRLVVGLGSTMSWNGELKKNGAYERRFDRPYAPEAPACS